MDRARDALVAANTAVPSSDGDGSTIRIQTRIWNVLASWNRILQPTSHIVCHVPAMIPYRQNGVIKKVGCGQVSFQVSAAASQVAIMGLSTGIALVIEHAVSADADGGRRGRGCGSGY